MKRLRFPDDLEADYQVHLSAEKTHAAWWTNVLGALLFMTYGILDVWALPFRFQAVWILRIIVVLLIFVVALLLRYFETVFMRHYNLIIGVEYLLAGLAIEGMIYLAAPSDVAWNIHYVGLLLICMAMYSWTFLRVEVTIPIGVLLLALYVLVAIGHQDMSRPKAWFILVSNCFLLVSANIIGMTSQQMRAHFSRENYILQRSLESKLEVASIERRQSEFLAKHDLLTGLPNRRYLLQRINEMIEEANRKNEPIAVLFLDLDGFKPINDTYGHETGDTVLQILSSRLQSRVRRGDMVARLGGDEFVVALTVPAKNLMTVTNRLAQEIILALNEPIMIQDFRLRIFASVGVALYPHDGTTANALLSVADERMYQAKRAGKNRVSIALSA